RGAGGLAMGRVVTPTIELALGGSYFAKVEADTDVRVGDWRMNVVPDVFSTDSLAGQYMVPNYGESFYGEIPAGAKTLRLYSGSSKTPITTRGSRQVAGVIPDGWPGLRFTAASQEW